MIQGFIIRILLPRLGRNIFILFLRVAYIYTEYQYDIIEGLRIPAIGQVSEEAKKIRAEIEELKELDPTLSDWDALEMLHDVVYEMVVRYGINNKEESLPILIKARHIMKAEGLDKWEAVDRILEE